MVCGTFTLTGLTSADADDYVNIYKMNKPPPISVNKTPEPGGATFSVVAVFPPCPPGTTHDTNN
jgi:hypothetical protein